MNQHLSIPQDKIEEFCSQHHVCRLSLFGSALRWDFGPHSDVDLLVEFEPGHVPGLMKLVDMENELSEVIGRQVDFVDRQSLDKSENYIRRRHVLKSLEPVYVA